MEDISSSFAENDLFLIISGANSAIQEDPDIVSQLVENNYSTIVITSNQPYVNIKKSYEKKNIDLSNVYFIDLITRYALGREPENNDPEKCIYISNPANLTDTGIAVNEMLSHTNGNSAVVFDSITTMLIYMSSDQLSKFIHFLTNKFRLTGVKGFFIAVEGGLDPALEIRFTTFMDVVIKNPAGVA